MRKLLLLALVGCGGAKSMYVAESMPSPPQMAYAGAPRPEAVESSESYTDYGKNPWIDASKDRLSTFAADVDTASYTIARRKLHERAAAAGEVRVEEWVNYFHYSFRRPRGTPFSVVMEAAPHPFAADRYVAARRRRDEGEDGRRAQAVRTSCSSSTSRARWSTDDKLAAREARRCTSSPTTSPRRTRSRSSRTPASTRRRAADDEHRSQGAIHKAIDALLVGRLDRDGLGHRPRLRAGGEVAAARRDLARDRAAPTAMRTSARTRTQELLTIIEAVRSKASRCRRSASAWATTRTR